MKINRKVLSIPPYVSTSWKNIASLHVEGNILVLVLHNSSRIEIPDLEKPILEAIFDAHAKYLEAEQQDERTKRMAPPAFMDNNNAGGTIPMGFPLKIGMNGIEALGSAMQHNPDQADAPDIPPEIINKIASIAKVLGIDDPDAIPKPEPHCNCMHCQIAKAMQKGAGINSEEMEEEVTEEDLKFRSWDVHQEDDKLYSVTNPIDQKEHYSVFLGEPIGCTCGNKNCEHIRAVLNS